MSGSQTPASGTPQLPAPSSSAADPSMEDILASIRRILSEDGSAEGAPLPAPPAEHAPLAVASPNDVLVLDDSMLVSDPAPAEAAPTHVEPPLSPVEALTGPETAIAAAPADDSLVAPAAAAAAATSVGSLVRTLAAGRTTPVYSGGPTIEDIVRQEIRPLLKDWLDTHLPPIVERFVRAEIERVVGRVVP